MKSKNRNIFGIEVQSRSPRLQLWFLDCLVSNSDSDYETAHDLNSILIPSASESELKITAFNSDAGVVKEHFSQNNPKKPKTLSKKVLIIVRDKLRR